MGCLVDVFHVYVSVEALSLLRFYAEGLDVSLVPGTGANVEGFEARVSPIGGYELNSKYEACKEEVERRWMVNEGGRFDYLKGLHL